MRVARLPASQLAEGDDLTKYEAAYDENNKRVPSPTFGPMDLTPHYRKHFSPDVDPSPILNEEAAFHGLIHCNWDMGDLQIQDLEGSAQDNPEAS